jgi:hypothetical protein
MDFGDIEPRAHLDLLQRPSKQPQFLEGSSLDEASRTSNTLFDHTPNLPPSTTRGGTGATRRYGHALELLEPEAEIDCIRKLSQLSIDLFEHSNSLPPISIYDTSLDDIEKDPAYLRAKYYCKYAAEDTFRLTESLIDLYPTFLNAFLPHPTTSYSSESTTWLQEGTSNAQFQTSQHPATGTESSSQASCRPPLDHSSIHLILSCHIRVIDIYEALFQHMKLCLEQHGFSQTPQQDLLSAPQLKIGSYTPPPSAAVPMQMLLLVQFSSQLSNYSIDLASALEELEGMTPRRNLPNSSAGDDAFAATQASAENVKSRASCMLREMSSIRVLLLNSGLLA